LEWEDVRPPLEAITESEDLQAAVEDPEAFLESFCSSASGKMASKIAAMRQKLQPQLTERGLHWDDVRSAMVAFETPEELQAAADHPEGLLSSGKLATQLALAALRPKLEPSLKEKSLEWEDVKPVLEMIVSPEELQAVSEDPEAFLDQSLAGKSGPASKLLAIAAMRPKLEPSLTKRNIDWEDARPALMEALDSPEMLQAAADDPDAWVDLMMSGASESAPVETGKKKARKSQSQKSPRRGSSKGKAGGFQLDVSSLPPNFKRVYELFFDTSSPRHIIKVFKTVALSFASVLKSGAKFLLDAVAWLRKCLPPTFPIFTDIYRDIGMLVMNLDFKLRAVPWKFAKGLRRILGIPADMLRFGASTRMIMQMLREAMKPGAMQLPQKAGSAEDVRDDNDENLEPTKEQIGQEELPGEMGEVSKEAMAALAEAETIPEDMPPGDDDEDSDDDAEEAEDEEPPPDEEGEDGE